MLMKYMMSGTCALYIALKIYANVTEIPIPITPSHKCVKKKNSQPKVKF